MWTDFLQGNWFGDEEGPGGVPPAVIFLCISVILKCIQGKKWLKLGIWKTA